MNKPILPLTLLLLFQLLQAPITHSDQADQDEKVQGAYPFPQPSVFNLYSWPKNQHCSCDYYNPDISEFVRENAGAIAEYCGFSLQSPAGIYVVLDGASLRDRIQARNDIPGRNYYRQPYEQQILLISPEYHFDGPVRVAGKVRLCGLRGWLRDRNPELLALMDSFASDVTNNNPEYSTSCGDCESDNGSTAGKLLPESYNDYVKSSQPAWNDDRVKLVFRDNGEDSASLLVTWELELSNLRLYRVGQPVGGGLLAVSCKYRNYSICRHRWPDDTDKTYALLRNTVLEDFTGGSDFLLRLDKTGSLIMEFSQLNFVHNNNDSTIIDANEIVDIRLSNIDINNIGDQGRVLTLNDYYHYGNHRFFEPLSSFLKNINVNAQDGASITGFSFTSGHYHTHWKESDRLQLTGIHFGKGIKTGFLFTDDRFRLRATGNTGNTWASHSGEHCTGQPASGSIDFTDGTRCQEIVPVASVEVPIATAPTSLEHNIKADVVSAAPSVLPELPAKTTSGTGTVHKSGLWAGLLSLYALSVYY